MPLNLPTLAEVDASRSRAQPKGASRLQDTKAEKKVQLVDERAFKTEVWKRDAGCCRKCGRKVLKGLSRVPQRGEVHHLHGRTGDLRFESKAAILVCLECHEKLTGRVNEKWIAVGTKFWTVKGDTYIDARAKLKWERTA